MEDSLNSTNFLQQLAPHTREELLALGKQRQINKDQPLFQAGSPANAVYMLLDGHVKIFQVSRVGKEIILWFCFPYELFGLAEVLDGTPRTVSAQAINRAEVLVLPEQDFHQFLRQHPEATLSLLKLMSCRMRILSDSLLNLATEDVASRIIKVLDRMGRCYGNTEEDGLHLNIQLTHQNIADMVGTSRQTVTTILSQMRKQNLIRSVNHRLIITDTDRFNSWPNISSKYGRDKSYAGQAMYSQ